MAYMFRIKFRMAPLSRVDVDGGELVLHDDGVTRVYLGASTGDFSNTDLFALRGEGFATEDAAWVEGRRWTAALPLGMVSERLGVDFYQRQLSSGGASTSLLTEMSVAVPGVRGYRDQAGLIVLPQHPTPMFMGIQATGSILTSGIKIAEATQRAHDHGVEPDARSLLAFEMFTAAGFMPTEDARFLMYMLAVEALIEEGHRSQGQVAAIKGLMAHLKTMDIDAGDADTLRQALGNLKRESIGASGANLAAVLEPRTYLDMKPGEFFRTVYIARSNMVHGNIEERPSPEQVVSYLGPLEFFVRDLILAVNPI